MTKLLNYLAPAAILMALALTGCSGSYDKYERPPVVTLSVPAGQTSLYGAAQMGDRWLYLHRGQSCRINYTVNPPEAASRIKWDMPDPDMVLAPGLDPNSLIITAPLANWGWLGPMTFYPTLLHAVDTKTGLGVAQFVIRVVNVPAVPPADGEAVGELIEITEKPL
jgi:hypothetical protein